MKTRHVIGPVVVTAAAAVLSLAGCASETVPPVVSAPKAGLVPVVAAAPAQINVFGEVDGKARAGPRSALSQAMRQHSFVTEGADADVSLDPSGKWMVFTSTRHSVHPKIYLQKTDGVTVTQLTTDEADDANPVFSPDGKRIAFASNRSGKWSLYLTDADGKSTVQLTNARTHDLHPSFSPDGSQIVYCSLGERSGQWEIWTMDLASGARRMIGEGLFPVWSPDKSVSRIAFQRARQRGGRLFSVWTLDLEQGEPRRLTEVAFSANAALLTPSWSPDGRQIAFATVVTPPEGVEAPPQHDLWVVDVDGTNRRRLTDGVGVAVSPAWSPDGHLFFVSDRNGPEAIWSVSPQAAPAMVAGKAAPAGPGGSTPTATTNEPTTP